MTFSWVARALSGLPFTLTNNTIDLDRNGTLFDPIAAGTYTGAGTVPTDNYTVEDFDGKRNGARGPASSSSTCGSGTASTSPKGRTSTSRPTSSTSPTARTSRIPSGNQGAPATFLVISALRDGATPRTLQLGVRFGF